MFVRTRIAPSPTGEFHIGSLRTFLYDYALARKNGGQVVVRIEDTDRNRYVDGSEERMLDAIKAYGFDWDEGPRVGGPYGPYKQSERLPLYKKYAEELVAKGAAYYCFCTTARLEQLRKEQQAQGLAVTKYDKHCATLSADEVKTKLAAGEKYVIRLKVPANETLTFTDAILGEISYNTNDLDDQVLLKSDGFPTYHLGVVVDDHLMHITHVIRAMEWLPSTPKHVLLYKAFGWDMPVHAHVSDLKEVNSNKKLSKRDGSVAAADFLAEGYLPEAVDNFLMLLGWNPGTEKELYSVEEFVQDFSLERVQKSFFSSFDRQKLLWFNGIYIRKLSAEKLWEKIQKWAETYDVALASANSPVEYTQRVVGLVQERLTKLSDFNDLTWYFYTAPGEGQNSSLTRKAVFSYAGSDEKALEIIGKYYDLYQSVNDSDWTKEHLETISHAELEKNDYKPKEAFMTLRLAVTGEKATPPLFDVLAVLGKDEVLKRLARFCQQSKV